MHTSTVLLCGVMTVLSVVSTHESSHIQQITLKSECLISLTPLLCLNTSSLEYYLLPFKIRGFVPVHVA